MTRLSWSAPALMVGGFSCTSPHDVKPPEVVPNVGAVNLQTASLLGLGKQIELRATVRSTSTALMPNVRTTWSIHLYQNPHPPLVMSSGRSVVPTHYPTHGGVIIGSWFFQWREPLGASAASKSFSVETAMAFVPSEARCTCRTR